MRVIIICMPSAITGKSTRFYGNNSGPELRKTSPESDYFVIFHLDPFIEHLV